MSTSNENTSTKENKSTSARTSVSEDRAVIGAGTTIKGDLAGTQDILIQGTVEGTINLKDNVVTIGTGSSVTADITGRVIHIEGTVKGDLVGTEKIVVHATGNIRGNITSPRLSLEDGARLKGAIDTDPQSAEKRLSSSLQKEKSSGKKSGPEVTSSAAATKLNGEAATS